MRGSMRGFARGRDTARGRSTARVSTTGTARLSTRGTATVFSRFHERFRECFREATPPARRTRRWNDRGVSMLEFAGFLPILLVIGMAAIQLGLIGYGINQAGTGARAAARVASQNGNGQAAGAAAVSGWLKPAVDAPKGPDTTTTATVTVTVPPVIPLFDGWSVTRHVTMPNDPDPFTPGRS